MFQLESSDDLGRKLVFPLIKVKTTIGRDPSSDIVLQDEDVSRHHCRLYVMNAQVKIKDEDSANGTFVNNVRVKDMIDVPVGAELIIGSNQFYLRSVEDLPEEENLQLTTMLTVDQLRDMTQSFDNLLDQMPPPSDQIATTMVADKEQLLENIYQKKIDLKIHPSLEVIYGPDKGRKYLLTPGEHRIGRGGNCNIHLADPMISGVHATVEVDGASIIFTDEGSRNGSILNNKIVHTHPLHHKDVLVLGGTKMKFVYPLETKGDSYTPPAEQPAEPPAVVSWLAKYGVWVTVGIAALALLIIIFVLYGLN